MSYPRLIQLTIAQIVGILLKKKIEMINIRVTESVSFGTDKLPLLILPNRHLRYSTLDILKIVQIMWLKRKKEETSTASAIFFVVLIIFFVAVFAYWLWQRYVMEEMFDKGCLATSYDMWGFVDKWDCS